LTVNQTRTRFHQIRTKHLEASLYLLGTPRVRVVLLRASSHAALSAAPDRSLFDGGVLEYVQVPNHEQQKQEANIRMSSGDFARGGGRAGDTALANAADGAGLPNYKDQIRDVPVQEQQQKPHVPSFKDQAQTTNVAGSAGGAETETADATEATTADDRHQTIETPIAYGRLMGDSELQPQSPTLGDTKDGRNATPANNTHRKHMIWALAAVCVAVVIGVVVAIVLTVGGGDDGNNEVLQPAAPGSTVITLYYVQIALFPFTDLLAGEAIRDFELGTDNFYEDKLPPDTFSSLVSTLLEQTLIQQDRLSCLVQLNSTSSANSDDEPSASAIDTTLLTEAVVNNQNEYIGHLNALNSELFGEINEVNAVPAAPPDTTGVEDTEKPTAAPKATTPSATPPSIPVPIETTAPAPAITDQPNAAVPPTTGTDNDTCEKSITIFPKDDDSTAVVVGSTVGAIPASNGSFDGSPAVYYQFTMEAGLSRRLRISTCTPDTNFPTEIHVLKGLDSIACPEEGGLYRSDFSATEPDLFCDNANAATMEFVSEAGVTYRLAVAGRLPTDVGTFGLSVSRFVKVSNDECSNAETLEPKDDDETTVVVGSTSEAVPARSDLYGGSPVVYYKFEIPAGLPRRVRVSTCQPETNFDTALYVLKGLENIACPESGGLYRADFSSTDDLECDATGNAATVEFVAEPGTNYRIAVAGRASTDVGQFGLSLSRFVLVENDECANAIPVLPNDDDFSTSEVGTTINAAPARDDLYGGTPVTYYKFSFDGMPRRVRISTCTPETDFPTALHVLKGLNNIACPEEGGLYRSDFTSDEADPECDLTQNAATIEIVVEAGETYRIAVAGRSTGGDVSGNFGLSVSRFVMVENDECDNAILIAPTTDLTAVAVASTTSAVPANGDTYNGSRVVYYRFAVQGSNRQVRVSTCTPETDFATALYVLGGLDNIACLDTGGLYRSDMESANDPACGTTANAATIEFEATAGTTYRIAVAGRSVSDAGTFGLTLSYVS